MDLPFLLSTIETKVSKREIKITTTKGSDDDAYLVRVLLGMNSKLGTLVYIDDTGDNKIIGIGQGVSVQSFRTVSFQKVVKRLNYQPFS